MNHIEIWLTVLSALVLFSLLVMILIVRQLGIVMVTVGPVGARETASGPRIGENISLQTRQLISFEPEKVTLMIFGSRSCAVCDLIKKSAFELHRYWQSNAGFVFVYDDETSDRPEKSEGNIPFYQNKELRNTLGIKMLPFALVVDNRGYVKSQGLVNDISQLESLLEAA